MPRSPEALELQAKITAQGDHVRKLKSDKAEQAQIDEALVRKQKKKNKGREGGGIRC